MKKIQSLYFRKNISGREVKDGLEGVSLGFGKGFREQHNSKNFLNEGSDSGDKDADRSHVEDQVHGTRWRIRLGGKR